MFVVNYIPVNLAYNQLTQSSQATLFVAYETIELISPTRRAPHEYTMDLNYALFEEDVILRWYSPGECVWRSTEQRQIRTAYHVNTYWVWI